MLKTLGKTTWDEIEVGEVFAWNGCWTICIKTKKGGLVIESDHFSFQHCHEMVHTWYNHFLNGDRRLYKLPLSVQRLWRQDT